MPDADLLTAVLDQLAELIAAKLGATYPPQGPPAPSPVAELRTFTDEEVRKMIGGKLPTGISTSTLCKLRRDGLLESGYLHPGSRERRTTPEQFQAYLDRVKESAARRRTAAPGADIDDQLLDERLDDLSVRRRNRRALD